MDDLNHLCIDHDSGAPVPLSDHGVTTDGGLVTVYFKNLEERLIEHIRQADYAVGCVAWMTHPTILAALANTKGVAIVIQKEDWLRPDVNARKGWKADLHARYDSLPGTLTRYDAGFRGTALYMMSCCSDPSIAAVRCVGNYHSERKSASPRSHHKFVVFCRQTEDDEEVGYGGNFEPYAVWTGSFNFTQNAVVSFENAVLLRHSDVARAYFREFSQIAALSEPLNWESQWSFPEWRIGT